MTGFLTMRPICTCMYCFSCGVISLRKLFLVMATWIFVWGVLIIKFEVLNCNR